MNEVGYIPHMLDGMSAQPDEVRLPSQSKFELNTVASAMFGLGKRPGSRYSGLSSATAGQFINLEGRGRYMLQARGTNYLKIQKLVSSDMDDGLTHSELTAVLNSGSGSYYENARTLAKAAGSTFYIVNPTYSPASSSSLTAALTNKMIVEVREAIEDGEYSVGIELGGLEYVGTVVTKKPIAQTTTASANRPPKAFSLTTPTAAQSVTDPTPTFTWEDRGDATSWEVTLYESNGTPMSTRTVLEPEFTYASTDTPMANGIGYKWSVTAVNADGRTDNKLGLRSFTFNATAAPAPSGRKPGSFKLLTPLDKAGSVDRRPAFSWKPAKDASTYRLEIANNAFNKAHTLVLTKSGIVGTDYATTNTDLVTPLTASTSYRWRVIAIGSGGVERLVKTGSKGRPFTTTSGAANSNATAPSTPTWGTPNILVNGTIDTQSNDISRRPTITWAQATNANSGYRVEIYKRTVGVAPTASDLALQFTVGPGVLTYAFQSTDPSLSSSNNYWVRVMALNQTVETPSHSLGTGMPYFQPGTASSTTGAPPDPDTEEDKPAYALALAADIAEEMAAELREKLSGVAGWVITQFAGTPYFTVTAPSTQAFNVWASDSQGGRAIRATFHEVQTFADLPAWAPNGYVCKIRGDPESGTDDYWVKFQGTSNNDPRARGTWEETVGPGLRTEILVDSMPRTLVWDSAQSRFEYDAPAWASRDAGDDTTCPPPTFLGTAAGSYANVKNIIDVCVFQNRLALLTEDTLYLSRADSLYNFWRTSAVRVFDDDPIEVALTVGDIANKALAMFTVGDSLAIIGTSSQLLVGGGSDTSVTPSTVRTRQIGSYQILPSVRPVQSGTSIYASGLGKNLGVSSSVRYTHLYEFMFDGDQLRGVLNLTEQFPHLIGGGITQLAVDQSTRSLAICTVGGPVWVYKWTDIGNERVQSSWRPWTFGSVLAMGAIDGDLYIMADRFTIDGESTNWQSGNARVIEAVPLEYQPYYEESPTYSGAGTPEESAAPSLTGAGQPTCIDLRVKLTGVHSGGVTTFTLPYYVSPNTSTDATRSQFPDALYLTPIPDNPADPGELVVCHQDNTVRTVATVKGNRVTVAGNYSSGQHVLGLAYGCRYVFSRFDKKVNIGSGTSRVPAGRLQLTRLSIGFNRTRSFKTVVRRDRRTTAVQTVTASNVGYTGVTSPPRGPGRPGQVVIPLLGFNYEVEVELAAPTAYPVWWTGGVWEGFYSMKGR